MRRPRPLTVLVICLLLGVSGAQQLPAGAAGQHAFHNLIFAGWQGGRVFSSADGHSWREADAGLPAGAGITAIAPTAGIVYLGTAGAGVYSSLGSVGRWQDSNGGSPVLRGAQVRGLAVDPRDSGTVFVATAGGDIFHSRDGGRHWSAIPLPISSPLTALIVDPRRPATLLVGTAGDGIAVSRDGGNTWNVPDAGVPAGVAVNGIAGDPRNADVAYGATTDGIYQTIDGGASWQPERRGIAPDTNLLAVGVDPRVAASVVAGSADGRLFRSTDGGTGWHAPSGAGAAQINTLTFDPFHPGQVLAGTADGRILSFSTSGRSLPSSLIRRSQQGGVLCLATTALSPTS